MHRRRPILAWLLLVAFVTGGVAAPALHRAQHGAAQIADRSEKPCHAAGVHNAGGPVWADAAADLPVPECDLCATRLLVVPPTPAPPTTSGVVGTTAVETRSHVIAGHVADHWFIRGPPSLPEARLA